MISVSSGAQTSTIEDYLPLEIESDLRREYRDGTIVPTTGGTPQHNKITSALNALLWFEQFVKQSEQEWLMVEHKGLETTVSLVSVPIQLALNDLYEGLDNNQWIGCGAEP